MIPRDVIKSHETIAASGVPWPRKSWTPQKQEKAASQHEISGSLSFFLRTKPCVRFSSTLHPSSRSPRGRIYLSRLEEVLVRPFVSLETDTTESGKCLPGVWCLAMVTLTFPAAHALRSAAFAAASALRLRSLQRGTRKEQDDVFER